jgi:hypothetical protein
MLSKVASVVVRRKRGKVQVSSFSKQVKGQHFSPKDLITEGAVRQSELCEIHSDNSRITALTLGYCKTNAS